MEKRILIKETEPAAYRAMAALERYLGETQLTKTHRELVKIRASQINGCAFCIWLHTKDARAAGETEQRIYALSAWRESPYFTPEEKALLALTDEITLIANAGVSDAVYSEAARHFDENYLAQLIMAIVAINAWNRIGVSTRMTPPME